MPSQPLPSSLGRLEIKIQRTLKRKILGSVLNMCVFSAGSPALVGSVLVIASEHMRLRLHAHQNIYEPRVAR